MTHALAALTAKWLGVVTGMLLAFSAAGLVVLAWDRSPPFRLLNYTATTAYPGGEVRFIAQVWRDPARDCSVSITQFVIDAAGTLRVVPRGNYPDEMLDLIDLEHLDTAIPVAPATALGWATMRSVVLCRCNITQWVKPIEIVVERRFLVVPPPRAGAIAPGWIEPQAGRPRYLSGLTG